MSWIEDQEASEIRACKASFIKAICPSEQAKACDKELKYWGYTYYSEVLKEHKRATGATSGSALATWMRENEESEYKRDSVVLHDTSLRFERINTAVNKLSNDLKDIVHRHYVINEERAENRNDQPVGKYINRIGIAKHTYYRLLSDSKRELINLGVML